MANGHVTLTVGEPAAAEAEAVAGRLHALESQLAALQSRVPPAGPVPEGYAASSRGGSVYGAVAGYLPAFASAGGFWSRFGVLREFRLIFGMYVDSRYRVSRLTQLAVPGLIVAMVANYFFFNWLMIGVPLLTPILERAVLIVLAVALYQVLSREASRYGEVLAYLTRYGR